MADFDYFVVFAEMRTGSNFLEANLNSFSGLQCHGEAFNPHFIGYPNRDEVLGVTKAERDSDPARLLDAVRDADGLNGFRFFNDHDPRVLDNILENPRCAKIVLTRNPVESYVSWKIAKATGQWKLTNVKHARSSAVQFEEAEFIGHMEALQAFQVHLLNRLQTTGQTAFYVAYEDLQDVAVMNGIAAYLGIPARIEGLDKSLKKQNPKPMSEKVENFDGMARALARMDRFNLSRTPNFEPRRGPVVPTYVAAAEAPLLYLPIRSGPEEAVRRWLCALDGVEDDRLLTDFTQKSLREWKKGRPGHRSFTVVRHPVARLHAAFCDKILSTEEGSYGEIRHTLRTQFKVPLPPGAADGAYGAKEHRAAFEGFIDFVKANLTGQTAIRMDPHWLSQAAVLQGFADFASPDMVMREDRLEDDLAIIAAQIGLETMPGLPDPIDPHRERLAKIFDSALEDAVRAAVPRDFVTFGFGAYQP